MKNIKRIAVTVAVVLGLVAVWAGWGVVHVGAALNAYRIAFGMVGITAGQTARLNVTYMEDVLAPGNVGKKASDPEWVGQLQFLDDMGRVVDQETVRLMPGESAFFDIFFEIRSDIGVSAVDAFRQQVRGNIDWSGNKGTILGTVEVFDSETGRTQFVLPGTTVGGPSPHM